MRSIETTDPQFRLRLLRAMRSETNCWEGEYLLTVTAVARGLLDGTVSERRIRFYPKHSYPEWLSRSIAHQVGLSYITDPPVWSGGWRLNVSGEAIGIAIQVLRAIPAGDAGVDEGRWSFYPETLEQHQLHIDDIRAYMAGLDLREAAQLIVDSDAIPIHEANYPQNA